MAGKLTAIFAVLFTVFLQACTLSPSDPKFATVTFRIDTRTTAPLLSSFAVPPTVSGFDCYGVNVVGNGIPAARPQNDNPELKLPELYNGKSCTYPGITTPPIAPGQDVTVSLTIPAGPRRIIQVAGIVDPNHVLCGSGAPLGSVPDGVSNSGVSIYEIGRAVVDLFKNQAIAIDNAWDSLTSAQQLDRKMNCGGSSGPFNPANVGGMVGWYKAEDFLGMGPDGDPIASNWVDRSPNPNGVSLAPGGSGPPVFRTAGGPLGLPAVEFDATASNYFYTSNGYLGLGRNGITAFFVVRRDSASGGYFGVSSGASFSPSEDFMKVSWLSTVDEFKVNLGTPLVVNASASWTTQPTMSLFYVVILKYDSSDNVRTITMDTDAGHSVYTSMGTTGPMNLDGSMYFGGFGGGFSGRISEIMIYDHALSSSSIFDVQTYLENKYGL